MSLIQILPTDCYPQNPLSSDASFVPFVVEQASSKNFSSYAVCGYVGLLVHSTTIIIAYKLCVHSSKTADFNEHRPVLFSSVEAGFRRISLATFASHVKHASLTVLHSGSIASTLQPVRLHATSQAICPDLILMLASKLDHVHLCRHHSHPGLLHRCSATTAKLADDLAGT